MKFKVGDRVKISAEMVGSSRNAKVTIVSIEPFSNNSRAVCIVAFDDPKQNSGWNRYDPEWLEYENSDIIKSWFGLTED